ncbi:MAG TPA: ABC-F family ATP-binding cassette domain-containing protein, partial [Thermomicrobiales bacterium]|nr:ABC-F family ATP-binding cassette domain-containing protein [Thermomicrobiales bacterium]
STGSDGWLAAYAEATEHFETLGGYTALTAIETALARFGLEGREWATPLTSLSGGEKTRAGLAALVTSRADYLLLDEPTNHLDRDGQQALADLLQSVAAGILVVSHDRQFLDAFATSLVVLDDETDGARLFTGSYANYRATMQREEETLAVAYRQQQELIGRVRTDISAVGSHALATERHTQNDYLRGRSKKVAKTAKVRERKLEKLLASEELIERPERKWTMAADFAPATESGRDVVRIEDATVALGGRTILDHVDLLIRSGDRVAITGANGAGKSTLLRLIAGDREPDAGSVRIGANVQPGWFAQEGETLNPALTPVEAIRQRTAMTEGEVRAFLHRFLFTAANVLNPTRDLSYGERSRLALALLVLDGCNLLLLDEPLNHLDITSREQFEQALGEFTGTLVIVLHDLYAVERIANRMWQVADGGVREQLI